jgi:hypothetical protein
MKNNVLEIPTPDAELGISLHRLQSQRLMTQQSSEDSPSQHTAQHEMIAQPSTVFALKEQLVGNFIHSLLGSPGGPVMKQWMLELPYLMLHENFPTLRYAIYASSMALFSSMENDVVIRTEACKWYIMALKSEQVHLASNSAITDSALCAPMPDNWVHHMNATARLLELRGAEGFDTDFSHRLFCSVRLAMVRVLFPFSEKYY